MIGSLDAKPSSLLSWIGRAWQVNLKAGEAAATPALLLFLYSTITYAASLKLVFCALISYLFFQLRES